MRDLFENAKNPFLKIREHPKKGPYVQGLSEHPASNSQHLLKLLYDGSTRRKIAATLTNPKSSRSHSVFTITFLKEIKLHLIDLAGSERAGSRYQSSSRFKEGANINKSLVALGNVISALAEQSFKKNQKRKFIPYRDSILTWLLKDTLGGNSKTVMIASKYFLFPKITRVLFSFFLYYFCALHLFLFNVYFFYSLIFFLVLTDVFNTTSKFMKLQILKRFSFSDYFIFHELFSLCLLLRLPAVSPSSSCYNETLNTLRFGHRAKQIILKPVVNEDPRDKTIRELREEIVKLREILKNQVNLCISLILK